MKYSKLFESGATASEIQAFLVGSGLVPVTIRIPRSLRDSAREAASRLGLTFASFVGQGISRSFPFLAGGSRW